jgi:hypothetical protein
MHKFVKLHKNKITKTTNLLKLINQKLQIKQIC